MAATLELPLSWIAFQFFLAISAVPKMPQRIGLAFTVSAATRWSDPARFRLIASVVLRFEGVGVQGVACLYRLTLERFPTLRPGLSPTFPCNSSKSGFRRRTHFSSGSSSSLSCISSDFRPSRPRGSGNSGASSGTQPSFGLQRRGAHSRSGGPENSAQLGLKLIDPFLNISSASELLWSQTNR